MIDYFMENLWQLWALISLICLILELTNGDFFIMCFAIGGVFSAVAAALGLGGVAQIIVFAVFTVLSLMFVRPIGTVSEPIVAGGHGRVAIDGDDWKAVSADGSAVDKGSKVKVVGRESIIITVEKV